MRSPETLTLTAQSTIRDSEFKVPLFAANSILVSFVPDITHRTPNLPDPGIGQYLTCKMLVDNGFGHNLWKRIEKERAAWVERNRAAEALRELSAPEMSSPRAPAPPAIGRCWSFNVWVVADSQAAYTPRSS